MSDVARERPVGLEMIEVAQVMAENACRPRPEGERRLQLAAHGQDRPGIHGSGIGCGA